MRKRTKARHLAIQLLYQIDITHDSLQEAWSNFWLSQDKKISEDVISFSQQLVTGTMEHLKDIDTAIVEFADNWNLERMAVVDRNILRLGCYEILFCPDIPPKVTINEAVELAKCYSGPESGKFVNGILDKIMSRKKSEVC